MGNFFCQTCGTQFPELENPRRKVTFLLGGKFTGLQTPVTRENLPLADLCTCKLKVL